MFMMSLMYNISRNLIMVGHWVYQFNIKTVASNFKNSLGIDVNICLCLKHASCMMSISLFNSIPPPTLFNFNQTILIAFLKRLPILMKYILDC
jgi:hypothetical protein